MQVTFNNLSLIYEADSLKIKYEGQIIRFLKNDYFKQAFNVEEYSLENLRGLKLSYRYEDIIFLEYVLFDEISEELIFEIETEDHKSQLRKLKWPLSLDLKKGEDVLPLRQGILLDRKEKEKLDLPFDGQFCSAAAYLPLIGQIDEESGLSFVWIFDEPYDMGYGLDQDEEYNRIYFYQLASLGELKRTKVRLKILKSNDYNDIAAYYREDCIKKGRYKTLKEKEEILPKIKDLSRCAFIHTGIATKVQKSSSFYDPQNPDKNNHLTTFSFRQKEIHDFHLLGIKHFYVHLDGWGVAYDNLHPDPFPINQEAGGEKDMCSFVKSLHQDGDLFGIHDQYRDFYFDSRAYDKGLAIQDEKGEHFAHNHWAGGWQNYLCARVAPDFVKKNFDHLNDFGIKLDCAYLDVFTCNELDECFNPDHLMTRKDCAKYREDCFKELIKRNIIPSSEEVNAWAIDSLVFCHYAPYEFMLRADEKKIGLPIPLFNLVYHECVMIPWMMDQRGEDYMLYALLNGGLPYFKRDAAYPNIDGAFEGDKLSLSQCAKRSNEVLALYDLVKYQKMLRHEYLAPHIQKTTFESGLSVRIDTIKNEYEISGAYEC